MPTIRTSTSHSPIISLCKKSNYTKSDLCRLMGISVVTLNTYIHDPGLIRLRDLLILAGCFGIQVERLTYLLCRTKPKIKKVDKWYIESLKLDSDGKEDV